MAGEDDEEEDEEEDDEDDDDASGAYLKPNNEIAPLSWPQ